MQSFDSFKERVHSSETSQTAKSYFGGEYRVNLIPYSGLDFSKRCFIFPGQSAAFAGMMKHEVQTLPALIETFARADELAVKFGLAPVSDYILKPSTINNDVAASLRNPALFALQVGLYRQLNKDGLKPDVLIAHSFGEYAAVVASGVARFDDIFETVVMRDRLSPPAKTTGLMLVVSASTDEISKALPDIEYFVSNINSPRQIVISLRPKDETLALANLKKARLAAKTLHEMPQPYHTPWMQETSQRLRDFLDSRNFVFSAPTLPLISSVRSELIDRAPGPQFSNRLAAQMCEPVLFPKQIKMAIERGAVHFVELGANEICSQFVKATLGEAFFKVTPIRQLLSGAEKAKPQKSVRLRSDKGNVLGILSKVIASVTGYSIDEISVDQSFQEDLGIDSIRKAEIVFQFMDAMKNGKDSPDLLQINLSQLKRIEDVIEHFETGLSVATGGSEQKLGPEFLPYEETWEEAPITDFEMLNFRGGPIVRLDLSEPPSESLKLAPGSILCLLAKASEEGARSLDEIFKQKMFCWISWLRSAAGEAERWPVRIALVVEPNANPYEACLDGLLRSWLYESGFESYKRIELLDHEIDSRIETEFADARAVDVRLSGTHRWVKNWTRRESTGVASGLGSDTKSPIVVSIGGARGIGSLILQRYLELIPQARLHVIGRSASSSPHVSSTMAKLRASGASVEYHQLDATDESRLSEYFAKVGPIDLILNGGGQEISRSLKTKDESEIWAELSGKAIPARVIAKLASKLGVGHVVNYSSVAAAFGNNGQSIYALANELQVLLGRQVASKSGVCVTSLILPPWDNFGMTANPAILSGLKAAGVALLAPALGAKMVVDIILQQPGRSIALLDSRDLRAYDGALTDPQAQQELFSRPLVLNQPIRLKSLHRRAQPYLDDHVINGNVIYPGSSALAMMYYAAYHYFKATPVLEKFEVCSFLKPELDRSNCDIHLTQIEEGRIKIQIASAQTVHFVCEAIRSPSLALTNRELFTDSGSIECKPLYGNEHITLGPHFQLAQSVWFNTKQELQQLSLESALTQYTQTRSFDRLAQWFESALQVMGCQLLWNTRYYWVPNRIARVITKFDRGLTDEIFYRVDIDRVSDGHALGTAYAANKRGETIFELQGVEDISVGRDTTGGHLLPKDASQRIGEMHV